MTLKDLLKKIEASDILETGWGTEPVLSDAELFINLEHLPRDPLELAEMTGLALESDYEAFYDDSGVCEGYAVLTDRPGLIVATLSYRLPEYCDDECDGCGDLHAVVTSSQAEFDCRVCEVRERQWQAALHDSLMAATSLLRCSPLEPKAALRALLECLLPREETERIRCLNGAASIAVQELLEESLRGTLARHAPGLVRIEWTEKAEDDAGGFYTYLESIDLVAACGERFHLGSDDEPFWLCEQYQTMEDEGVFGDQDPPEAFGAYLCKAFGFEGDFDDLWDTIQSLVSVLRGQGHCAVDLRLRIREAHDEAA